MTLGLVGRKVGMTRVFNEQGASVPVTVLEMSANRVTQVKSKETDGYTAVQVTFGAKKANRVNKAEAGHFAKAGVEAGRGLHEFLVSEEKATELKAGDVITGELFQAGQLVDITGTIKRHNFGAQRTSHGNSRSHRVPGSIGMAQDPGRVFPGKRMAGQYGNTKSTVQHLEIVRVDVERNLLLVKGAVPGAVNSDVVVRHSVKKAGA